MSGPVTKITFCYQFGYHDKPFIHGVRDGKDVWLRDDGVWTEEEGDPRIGLAVKISFYPGGTWNGDQIEGWHTCPQCGDTFADAAVEYSKKEGVFPYCSHSCKQPY